MTDTPVTATAPSPPPTLGGELGRAERAWQAADLERARAAGLLRTFALQRAQLVERQQALRQGRGQVQSVEELRALKQELEHIAEELEILDNTVRPVQQSVQAAEAHATRLRQTLAQTRELAARRLAQAKEHRFWSGSASGKEKVMEELTQLIGPAEVKRLVEDLDSPYGLHDRDNLPEWARPPFI